MQPKARPVAVANLGVKALQADPPPPARRPL